MDAFSSPFPSHSFFFLPATLAQYIICQCPYPRVIFIGRQICWKTDQTSKNISDCVPHHVCRLSCRTMPDHSSLQYDIVPTRVSCREGSQQNQHSCVYTLSYSMRPIAIPNALLWLWTTDASSFAAEVEVAVTQATVIIHTVRPHWKDVGYLLVPLQRLCTLLWSQFVRRTSGASFACALRFCELA